MVISESSLEQINGVSGSVKHVADHFREHNFDARILTPKPKPDGGEYNGYKVKGMPKIKLQGFHVGIPTKAAVHAEVRSFQPDLIHFASPVSKLGNVGLKAAQALEIPSVAIYQTDVAQYARRFAGELVDKSTRRELKWLKHGAGVALESLLGERIAELHNRASLTLAPSRPAMQRLIDFGVEPGKIRLWGRGIDAELFTPSRSELFEVKAQHQAWSHDGQRIVVGYVGRLAPEKSVHKLASLRALNNIQLVVVGDGPSRPELEQLLGTSDTARSGAFGVRRNEAIFTGKLTGDALANAYASFDIFAHTGAEETFGQTLQEAMASGLPVVAPAAGGPLDIVNNGVSGLLYSHDSDEQFVSSIETIAADTELREAMGRAGVQAVTGRTWERLGDELLDHYYEVLEK